MSVVRPSAVLGRTDGGGRSRSWAVAKYILAHPPFGRCYGAPTYPRFVPVSGGVLRRNLSVRQLLSFRPAVRQSTDDDPRGGCMLKEICVEPLHERLVRRDTRRSRVVAKMTRLRRLRAQLPRNPRSNVASVRGWRGSGKRWRRRRWRPCGKDAARAGALAAVGANGGKPITLV